MTDNTQETSATGTCVRIMAIHSPVMSVCASVYDRSGIPVLRESLYGRISESESDVCRQAYHMVNGHKSGIVVLCIDGLRLFDQAAAAFIINLARRAVLNLNTLCLVVGTGPVRDRAQQAGLTEIAHLYDTYEDVFLPQDDQ